MRRRNNHKVCHASHNHTLTKPSQNYNAYRKTPKNTRTTNTTIGLSRKPQTHLPKRIQLNTHIAKRLVCHEKHAININCLLFNYFFRFVCCLIYYLSLFFLIFFIVYVKQWRQAQVKTIKLFLIDFF